MRVRKLDPSEHKLTRPLWEEIFSEDTRAFLDYYYYLKTRDNEIDVVEEDGEIRSMLQLNPYTMRVGDTCFPTHYIVAVGTEEAYRKRGYMGALLNKAMRDMYQAKEPFTFLMPAAEAIYLPYQFRYIYRQKQFCLTGDMGECEAQVQKAVLGDAMDMSQFFLQHFSREFQVCTYRDEHYYQTLIFEQEGENGGIQLLKDQGELVGMFFWSDEKTLEIREPLCLPGWEMELEKAICQLRKDQHREDPVKVIGCFSEFPGQDQKEEPMIMARILHLESLLRAMKPEDGMEVDCSFAILDPIIRENNQVWHIQSQEEEFRVWETEDSEGVIPIESLTSFLFGYRTLEEISKEEGVLLSPHLSQELEKIQPLSPSFINEVV